jgi:Zn-dependent peptidase ImmA (M78 family)/DNA-binding XRE family transcriptional regulator
VQGSQADAVAVARAFEPARLTLARHLAGLTKRQLAAPIERTPAAVTQYELGQARPAPSVLVALAATLAVPIEFFTVGRPLLPTSTTTAHFRSLRSTRSGERDQALAWMRLVWELVAAVDEVVELPPVDLGALDERDRLGGPATAARALRAAWRLPLGPLPHLVRTLEAHGIVVSIARLSGSGRVDAFSAELPGRPIVVLTDARDGILRRRFTAAHELAHLALHHDPLPGDARQEREAQRFAAELLMPSEVICDALPVRADIPSLLEAQQTWGVSIAALAYTGRELGVYSDAVHRRIMVTLGRLGWRRNEPVQRSYPGEDPALLSRAIELAADHGTPLKAFAEQLRLPLPLVRALVGETVERPRLALVPQTAPVASDA